MTFLDASILNGAHHAHDGPHLAAAATATCGIVIIVAGIVAARSPIKAAPRRRAF
jgi:hypothetical protein